MAIPFAFQSARSPASLMDELEKFIVFWLGPRRPEYGEPESALETFPLPYPLRRLYAFAGRWPPLHKRLEEPNVFSVQDSLRSFSDLYETERAELVFLDENQGVWWCTTLPDGNDPPVWVEGDLGPSGAVERKLVAESLSRFLVTFCLQELLFGSKLVIIDEYLGRLFESAGQSAVSLWSNGPYVYSGHNDNYYDFYLFNDTVLVYRCGDSIFFGANSEAGIEFLISHQSKVVELYLDAPSYWSLSIKQDGSGEVNSSNGNVWGTFSSGTFDFLDLRDRLLSL